MTQYPNYEIERFEDEGGNNCYYPRKDDPEPTDRKLEAIPVIDLLGDDDDAGEEIQEHQES